MEGAWVPNHFLEYPVTRLGCVRVRSKCAVRPLKSALFCFRNEPKRVGQRTPVDTCGRYVTILVTGPGRPGT